MASLKTNILLLGILSTTLLLANEARDALLTGSSRIPSGAELTVEEGGSLSIRSGGAITANDGAHLNGIARAPRYAVVEIPLGIHNPLVTDFEVKITDTNFQGDPALLYFYGSQYGAGGLSMGHGGQVGTTTACYFTDSKFGGHDLSRQWRLQDQDKSIFQQRWSPDSVIGGVVLVIPLTEKINPSNPNITAIYQRIFPDHMEEIWVPVTLHYFRSAPTPPVAIEPSETP